MTSMIPLDEALGVRSSALAEAFRSALPDSPAGFNGPQTLRCLVSAQAAHDALLLHTVRTMRAATPGHNWEQIGHYLGMSRQAAHKRFAHLCD